jgi:hypothetical protein
VNSGKVLRIEKLLSSATLARVRALGDILRIDDRYFCVAFEVTIVEGKEIGNIMDEHGCNKARVVRLFAENLMLYDNLLPTRKDIRSVGQNAQEIFQSY